MVLDSRQARSLVLDFLRQVRVHNGIIFLEVGRKFSPDADVQSTIALSVQYNELYTDGSGRILRDFYYISSLTTKYVPGFQPDYVPGPRKSSRSSYQNIVIGLAIAVGLWAAQIIAAGGIDLD